MSAIRNSHRRSRSRFQLPYARPPPKKSSWSIAGFLSFLNPLRSKPPQDEYTSDTESRSSSPDAEVPYNSDTSQATVQAMSESQSRPNAATQPPSILHPSTEDLQKYTDQLRQTLGPEKLPILVSMLQQDIPSDKPEPFRFSSTPARELSPFQSNADASSFGSATSAPPMPSHTRRTLDRNPNGVYRWQGGGSAKTPRSKNRYSSTAFGSSESRTDRLVLKDTQVRSKTPQNDTKRRRMEDEDTDLPSAPDGSHSLNTPSKLQERVSTPPTRVLPFPVSTGALGTFGTSGSSFGVNVSPTPLLHGPPLRQKPTAPTVPSPLRQTWSGISHDGSAPLVPSLSKQTKAANFMAELIKEVTPPKRPDLSNPYQTASPFGKAVGATYTRVGKRTRAAGRPTAPKKNEKSSEAGEGIKISEKVYSPQAIIEATLPKGSKRSRPSYLEMPPLSEAALLAQTIRKETGKDDYIVEESNEDVEEIKRATKKLKPPSPKQKATSHNDSAKISTSEDILIEEVEVDQGNVIEKSQSVFPLSKPTTTSSNTHNRAVFNGSKSTSAPKEPSKLRYSYQPNSSAPSSPPFLPSVPPATSPSSTSDQPSTPSPLLAPPSPTLDTADKNVEVTEIIPISAKEIALAAPITSLPMYTFTVTSNVTYRNRNTSILSEVKSLPKSSLPSFDFHHLRVGTTSTTSKPLASPSALQPNDSTVTGRKPNVPLTASVTWTCATCMLVNPDSAKYQCTICDAPRLASIAPAQTKTFDWSAAGVKPPAAANTGFWTCSMCMLSNPATATDKCTVCDAPR